MMKGNKKMEGIKRIQEMAKGQKDFVLLSIVDYLTSREDMNAYYLNKEKSLKEMALYIQGEVIKHFCKMMNTKNPSSFAQTIKYGNSSVRCLPIGMSDAETYELAIQYFSKSNKELGITAEEIKKKIEKTVKDNKIEEKFGSIFGSIFETKQPLNNTEKKKDDIEQISFFSVA